MTIRLKMLVIAGMTLGLLVLLGAALFQTVQQGRRNRDRLFVIQDQFDSLGQLQLGAERYVRDLLRARDIGGETSRVLASFLATLEQQEAILEETSDLEAEDPEQQSRPEEWEETQGALRALRQWATQLEVQVRQQPPDQYTFGEEWRLFDAFEHDVGQLIGRARAAEEREREAARVASEQGLTLGARVAVLMPLASCVLLMGLFFFVARPVATAFQQLLAAARRLGAGDLHVSLPTGRNDEIGTLATAFNQMAQELRRVLDEKQQLIRAEAEATEREYRRYHALLEQTVRERTAELERTNVQLRDSLAQLKTAQSQLVFADRLAAMGQLAAGVGHEINNPLSYVLSNLHHLYKELVRLQYCLPEEDRAELLQVISETREGAERVRLIVRDLKELSRPEEGAPGPVNLSTVVDSTAKLVGREFYQRARLVMDCQGVPPVKGSMTRLGQVFLNLLINAAHAIPKGHEEQNEVRVVARVRGPEQVQVEVSDTGSGIAPEHLSRIFEPFFTTKPVGEGTGLGLSVCHSIVTSLGGGLEVSSEQGKGTTFRVLLPIATELPQEEPSVGGQRPPRPLEPPPR